MLSEEKAMEILNGYERKYSRSEVKIIKEFIERLCQIEYEISARDQKPKTAIIYTRVSTDEQLTMDLA